MAYHCHDSLPRIGEWAFQSRRHCSPGGGKMKKCFNKHAQHVSWEARNTDALLQACVAYTHFHNPSAPHSYENPKNP